MLNAIFRSFGLILLSGVLYLLGEVSSHYFFIGLYFIALFAIVGWNVAEEKIQRMKWGFELEKIEEEGKKILSEIDRTIALIKEQLGPDIPSPKPVAKPVKVLSDEDRKRLKRNEYQKKYLRRKRAQEKELVLIEKKLFNSPAQK